VFTARYALSPYIKQIRFVFKGLNKEIDKASRPRRHESSPTPFWEPEISQSTNSSVLDSCRLLWWLSPQRILLRRDKSVDSTKRKVRLLRALILTFKNWTWPKSGGFESSSCNWSGSDAPPSHGAPIPFLQASATLFFFFFSSSWDSYPIVRVRLNRLKAGGEGHSAKLHCRIV
jgi:hypothetical protein